MFKPYSNPCTRCGKERIVLKTKEQRIKTFSKVMLIQINSDTICPDPVCQKIVSKELRVQKKKRDKIKHDREQRALEHKNTNPRNSKTPKN